MSAIRTSRALQRTLPAQENSRTVLEHPMPRLHLPVLAGFFVADDAWQRQTVLLAGDWQAAWTGMVRHRARQHWSARLTDNPHFAGLDAGAGSAQSKLQY
jgi:hypothetical protein